MSSCVLHMYSREQNVNHNLIWLKMIKEMIGGIT